MKKLDWHSDTHDASEVLMGMVMLIPVVAVHTPASLRMQFQTSKVSWILRNRNAHCPFETCSHLKHITKRTVSRIARSAQTHCVRWEKKRSPWGEHSVMDLLPKNYAEFRSREYWDTFFRKRKEKEFEWYGDFAHIKAPLTATVTPTEQILVIGCGNRFVELLYWTIIFLYYFVIFLIL